jgi:hypothetical protein
LFKFRIKPKNDILTDMSSDQTSRRRYMSAHEAWEREKQEDVRLEAILRDAQGLLEGEDLRPVLRELTGIPSDNGLLNAIKRGVEAERFSYAIGPPLSPYDLAGPLIRVSLRDASTYGA